MRAFVRACLAKPVPAEDFETALCWNMAVAAADPRQPRPPARSTDDDVLRRPRGAAAGYPGPCRTQWCSRRWPSTSSPPARPPQASWYDGAGHVPHLEEPGRFNRELAALTRRVRSADRWGAAVRG